MCNKVAGVVPVAEKGLGPAAASLADDLTPCIGTATPATNSVPAMTHYHQNLLLQTLALPYTDIVYYASALQVQHLSRKSVHLCSLIISMLLRDAPCNVRDSEWAE